LDVGEREAMTKENMRREARADVRVPVVLYRSKLPVLIETSDVSFKGLFVCTTDPPPLRSLVRLRVPRVALPRDGALLERDLEAHAMAVHVVTRDLARGTRDANVARQPGVGLQFWGLAGPDRTAWDDFVRGVIQVRRAAASAARQPAPAPGTGEPPALSEPTTPSGVRFVVTPAPTSSK
jgi:hypothetical protein